MTRTVRPAAVSGRFYPLEPDELAEAVDGYIARADEEGADDVSAIIGPHAGYVFSGPTAGAAYKPLVGSRARFSRVALLGPSHYVAFAGVAAPVHDAFETPLGLVEVDGPAIDALVGKGLVGRSEEPHRMEHGLEVHLPFLQRTVDEFTLVPLVVGQTSTTHVAKILEALWREDTLVVVSSDLSHYLDYARCQLVDRRTCDAIEALEEEPIGPAEACGFLPVRGLLRLAREQGLSVATLDLRNSGDTAGDRTRVVGYGAWSFG